MTSFSLYIKSTGSELSVPQVAPGACLYLHITCVSGLLMLLTCDYITVFGRSPARKDIFLAKFAQCKLCSLPNKTSVFYWCNTVQSKKVSTLRAPWSNCYHTATASELIWLHRNVTGGRFSNWYESGQSQTLYYKLLAHWQWRGRSRCRLGLLRNTQSFCFQSAHTPAYCICWGIQLLVPPLGDVLTLKSLAFCTSFSVFHCLPVLSISRAGEAITKTVPRDRRKLIKLMLRKCTFLPPRLHLIGQFVSQHLVTIRRGQQVLAQWLGQCFCQDHSMCSVESVMFSNSWM